MNFKPQIPYFSTENSTKETVNKTLQNLISM